MKLEIYGRTNHDYCMVNTAIFHLKNGGTITIDREETEYRITDGDLSMLWKGLYVWAFNSVSIGSGDGRIYPHTSLIRLLEGATLELSLEDDAPDADYEVTNIRWCIFEDENEVFGSGYDVNMTEKPVKDDPSNKPGVVDITKKCTYCNEDKDGYVTCIDNNHVCIRPYAGTIHIKWHQYKKEIPINFCPMCGRKLRGGR